MKKETRISLIITIAYISLSIILFFGGVIIPESLALLEVIFYPPALIIFGFGYGGGNRLAIITGIILFFIIWLLTFGIVKIISELREKPKS